MSWGDAAYRVMQEVRTRCLMEGKKPDEIAKEIDAAYPFGERAMWPYKAWLKTRKEFFAVYGLPRKVPKTLNLDILDRSVHRFDSLMLVLNDDCCSGPTTNTRKG